MKTLDDFQRIVETSIGPVLKKMDDRRQYKHASKSDQPEFFTGYESLVSEMKSNRVHAFSEFPEKLFENIAPNQSDDDLNYLKSTYQCVTSDVFLEFSNTVKRGLRNGQIEWPQGKSEDETLISFKNYVKKEIPQFKSLYEFMKSLADMKLADANAVVAIDFDAQTDKDGLIDGGIFPYPVIYSSDRVTYIGEDGSVIVLSYENSIVSNGDTNERTGHVLYGYSPDFYFYAEQYGKKSEMLFEFTEFEHELDYIPAMRLMGMPKLITNRLYFTSPFYTAVHNLNLAVLDSANLLVIKRKVGYPTRVFVAQKCRNQKNGSVCNDGTIKWSDGEKMHSETCQSCKGTGMVGVFGPNSELLINHEETHEGNQMRASEAMAYISPSVDIPKFLREEIDKYIHEAKSVLHLKAEPRKTGDITATEKNIDLKNTEAFIKPISDQLWHLYEFILDCIGDLKVGKEEYKEIKPTLIAPDGFDIITAEDYTYQLAEAQKAGLPSFVIQSIIYNMIKSMNYSDSQGVKIFELIQIADRFWTATPDQVALALSRNTAQRWEVVLHDSALALIIDLASNYEPTERAESFFDLPIDQQSELLIEKAKAVTPQTGTEDLAPPIEI